MTSHSGESAMDRTRRTGRRPGQMLVVGLTGSIGMGKSTVSGWFKELGVPVNDADAVVHKLYAPGGKAVKPVEALFGKEVLSPEGGIDRGKLKNFVVGEENRENMQRLEGLVHPLVESGRSGFIADAAAAGAAFVVLDIPLLFEVAADKHCDTVLVVSAGLEKQRERVLARKGMDPELFEKLLAKQVPDSEKRARSDRVIDTAVSPEETRKAIVDFVDECRAVVARERRCLKITSASVIAIGLAVMALAVGRASPP